jgi:hypothetical protein
MKLFLTKSFSGLSDFENKGISGAFKFGKNLDVRKEMDSLSCQQALVDDLAVGTMTGTALFIVNCSDGNSYHFCRNGKIYKRTSLGVYSLVYTDADGVITGACEWVNHQGHKFLFWATSTRLRRKQIPGSTSWTDVDATVNAQTYPKTNLTATTWHTMLEMGGALYICNANTLAMVGYDDSYTNNALQLVPGNNAKCLMEYNNYAYIGCSRDDNSQRGYLFAWDMSQSLNWNAKRKQGGTPVNALIDAEYPLAQIGSNGKIRLADISQYSLPIKSLPGGGQVNPDGVEADDLAYFGSFGNTAESDGTTRTGVYTFGRLQHNANPVMNLEYDLDCDEIGYVKKVGTDLLISYYKSGVGYGVKKISTTTKATAIYRSIDFRSPTSQREAVWSQTRLVMKALPAGCSVSVRRKTDKKGSWTSCKLLGSQSTTFSTEGGTEAVFLSGDKGKMAEVEITLTPNGNETPEVYYFETIFE